MPFAWGFTWITNLDDSQSDEPPPGRGIVTADHVCLIVLQSTRSAESRIWWTNSVHAKPAVFHVRWYYSDVPPLISPSCSSFVRAWQKGLLACRSRTVCIAVFTVTKPDPWSHTLHLSVFLWTPFGPTRPLFFTSDWKRCWQYSIEIVIVHYWKRWE